METFVYAPPPPGPLPVLYEDDALLALNKPEGLLSVPGRLTAHRDSLYSRVLEQYPQAMVVHLLDTAIARAAVVCASWPGLVALPAVGLLREALLMVDLLFLLPNRTI